jgi:hypothetical protein
MDTTSLLMTGTTWIVLLVELVFAGAAIYVASVARKRGLVTNAAWLLAGGAILMVLFDCVATAGGTLGMLSPELGEVSSIGYLLANVVSIVALLAIGVSFVLFQPVRGGQDHG